MPIYNKIVVKLLLISISCMLPSILQAAELHLLEAEHLSIEYEKIRDNRDPYFPEYSDGVGEEWSYAAALKWDINVIRLGEQARVYWNNYVHMDATDRQVRHVGWQWELGLNLWNKVELFSAHHSRHSLERDGLDSQRFPVRDTYGVRLIIIDRYNK